jgi:hypothetical protein
MLFEISSWEWRQFVLELPTTDERRSTDVRFEKRCLLANIGGVAKQRLRDVYGLALLSHPPPSAAGGLPHSTTALAIYGMSRRGGIRFADKDMRQYKNLRRYPVISIH